MAHLYPSIAAASAVHGRRGARRHIADFEGVGVRRRRPEATSNVKILGIACAQLEHPVTAHARRDVKDGEGVTFPEPGRQADDLRRREFGDTGSIRPAEATIMRGAHEGKGCFHRPRIAGYRTHNRHHARGRDATEIERASRQSAPSPRMAVAEAMPAAQGRGRGGAPPPAHRPSATAKARSVGLQRNGMSTSDPVATRRRGSSVCLFGIGLLYDTLKGWQRKGAAAGGLL